MSLKMMTAAAVAMSLALAGGTAFAAEIKFGVIAPLSGGGTDWGIGTQRGVELAIDEINAAGGLGIGGETYTFSSVTYDDQYTGQGGTTAATRLIEGDGVKYIFGPLGSPPVLAAQAVAAPDKAMILSSGYSPQVLTPEGQYNFRITLSTPEFASAFTRWLSETHPDAKRPASSAPTTPPARASFPS